MAVSEYFLKLSLKCSVCPACRRYKAAHRTFCFRCFTSLPGAVQQSLRAPLGGGYEQAVSTAMNCLGKTTFITP
jgi:ribosomal protein L32